MSLIVSLEEGKIEQAPSLILFCFCATLHRLEKGDFKLRVRTLDVERQNERSKIVQRNSYEAIILSILFQGGVSFLTVGSGLKGAKPLSRILFGASAFLAARVPLNLRKLRQLDKYNEKYGIKA